MKSKIQTAGIQVGASGTTLTIKGNGSLTATGDWRSAGIGLSNAWSTNQEGGNIVIEGGNITALGDDSKAAGIGTGVAYEGNARLGNITIKGGTVVATGGKDGNGIGTGYCYSGRTNEIGTITIYVDVELVDASSINGDIIYKQGETDVTSNVSEYLTIVNDGQHRMIMQKDDTDYSVTVDGNISGGSVTVKSTAKAGEIVTPTIMPESGYRFLSLSVKDLNNNDVNITDNHFIMPKGGVTVSATFFEPVVLNDGVLTLRSNVIVAEVQAFKDEDVTSIVCEEGTELPEDCTGLFSEFENVTTIDLSNVDDVSDVKKVDFMFNGCVSLEKIYVNSDWNLESVEDGIEMFAGCESLEGDCGTRYDDEGIDDYTYAVIDCKNGPGYLTEKQ